MKEKGVMTAFPGMTSDRGDHVEDTVNVARAVHNFKRNPRKKSDFVARGTLFPRSSDPPGLFQSFFRGHGKKHLISG
jgi:hypothetical protein